MTEYFYTATYKPSGRVSPGTQGFTSGVYQSEKPSAKEAFEDLVASLIERENYTVRIQKFERI